MPIAEACAAYFLDPPESDPSPKSDELQSYLGEGATLCALDIQVFDEGRHPALLIDRDMVGNVDEQITARTAADQKKAPHRGNAGGEGGAQANMIHCIRLINVPTREAHSAYIQIIEMAHCAAIRLDLVHHVDGATDLDHFICAIGRPQEIKRHVRACCTEGRGGRYNSQHEDQHRDESDKIM